MRASGLGKVSRDKQQQASTSNNTIAADCDERNPRRSHIERRQSARNTSPLNVKRKAEAISFEATSGLANKRDKNVVRAS
jgi:hypothetical protein